MPTRGLHTKCINANGGIDVLITHFAQTGIWGKIDNWLGKRHYRSEYSYSECIQTFVMNVISGTRRLEQTKSNADSLFSHPKLNKGMSPDTISRIFRSLAVDNIYYSRRNAGPVGQGHERIEKPDLDRLKELNEVNENVRLNELQIDAAIALGIFKAGEAYEIDIDATIVPTAISDSRPHYKGDGKGYAPMVVLLAGIPMFMEVRNGNSSPAFRKKIVLKKAIDLFESRGLKIKFVRIDAAGDSHEVMSYLCGRGIKFYIRASGKRKFFTNMGVAWDDFSRRGEMSATKNEIEIGNIKVFLINYRGGNFVDEYGNERRWGIFTNDENIKATDAILMYNGRAAHENRFADLKEMGWNIMAHRELKFNAVYLHMVMLSYLFFIVSKRWLAGAVKFVKETLKPRTFIEKFVKVVTMWADGKIVFMNKEKEFAPLINTG